jgi:hypothetical protein
VALSNERSIGCQVWRSTYISSPLLNPDVCTTNSRYFALNTTSTRDRIKMVLRDARVMLWRRLVRPRWWLLVSGSGGGSCMVSVARS